MAADSRNVKRKRRQRAKISTLSKAFKGAQMNHFNSLSALLMVLAQSGGEKTVTRGTAQQVMEKLVKGKLSFTSVASTGNPNEFTIKLVEADDVANTQAAQETPQSTGDGVQGSTDTPSPAVTIRRITDDIDDLNTEPAPVDTLDV